MTTAARTATAATAIRTATAATAIRTATATTTAMTTTIFSELLGDRLLEHTIRDGAQVTNYIATSQFSGKTIGLYFS